MVKSHVVEQDGMIGMIRFEKMLQRPSFLVRIGFYIVRLDWFHSNACRAASASG